MKKIVQDFWVTVHGIEHEQYFQGYGISGTAYDDCATGIGDTIQEAYEDALESLAQNEWETDSISAVFRNHKNVQEMLELTDDEMQECDAHFYVSVSVQGTK